MWGSTEVVFTASVHAEEAPRVTDGTAEHAGTVLVVEDDPGALEVSVELLHWAGYRAIGVSSVAEALASATDAHPDLVVLDLRLGGDDGLDVARRLRDDAATRDIPVVVWSASTSQDDVARARAAGCAEFLAKALTPREFLRRLEVCLASARAD